MLLLATVAVYNGSGSGVAIAVAVAAGQLVLTDSTTVVDIVPGTLFDLTI